MMAKIKHLLNGFKDIAYTLKDFEDIATEFNADWK